MKLFLELVHTAIGATMHIATEQMRLFTKCACMHGWCPDKLCFFGDMSLPFEELVWASTWPMPILCPAFACVATEMETHAARCDIMHFGLQLPFAISPPFFAPKASCAIDTSVTHGQAGIESQILFVYAGLMGIVFRQMIALSQGVEHSISIPFMTILLQYHYQKTLQGITCLNFQHMNIQQPCCLRNSRSLLIGGVQNREARLEHKQ